MSDYIYIEGLEADTVIGVYDWEREIRQRLVIDLRLEVANIPRTAKTDNVQYTLDYAAISDRVVEYVQVSSFKLIESLAERIAELIMREFDVSRLRVKVSKPGAVPAARNVAVEIKRSRR